MATPFEEFIIPDFTDILLVINDLVLLGWRIFIFYYIITIIKNKILKVYYYLFY
jgi:hypothetical protein